MEMEKIITSSKTFEFLLSLLDKVSVEFENEVRALKHRKKEEKEETKRQLELLYTQEKRCSVNEQLMVCNCVSVSLDEYSLKIWTLETFSFLRFSLF